MPADDIFEQTVARLTHKTLIVATLGTIGATVWLGLRGGGSFALGAFASWLNLRWLTNFAGSLGPDPRRRSGFLFAFRYLVFGIGGYVIVKYIKINLSAALSGLFVSLAGAVIEIISQLTYARRNLGN
jgi:hypothetical protein